MCYKKEYSKWLLSEYFDSETKEELISIKDDENEIEERFYKNLEFGTGGLRGKIGAGTNRVNKYTIRRATAGLCEYIKKSFGKENNRVVIAHDNRYKSREFCIETAKVMAENGIKSYIFDDLRSTPELSFAVRYLKCTMGVVITASHNPKEYNGYKVYDSNGGQICIEVADNIIAEINSIKDYSAIKVKSYDEYLKLNMIEVLDNRVDDAFIDAVKEQIVNEDIVCKYAKDLKIVYTPIHGTGLMPISRVLNECGFKNLSIVEEQTIHDPMFSTVKYPNPEEISVFDMAKKLSDKVGADIIMGTDPDCDRVGLIVKNKKGEYKVLNGNQIGSLMVRYILENMNGNIPSNSVIIKTIVTSELGAEIASKYGVETINTLTGFKFIGEKINEFEKTNEKHFIMGYEDSYGYLIGTHARDKDRVVSALIICEIAAYCKSKDISIYEYMYDTYEKYGYYSDKLKSIVIEGKKGVEKISEIMTYLRNSDPNEIGFNDLLEVKDYKNGIDGLPKSNVLKFIMKDKSWLAIRPSGTEPKIKIYFGAKSDDSIEDSDRKLNSMYENIMNIIESI